MKTDKYVIFDLDGTLADIEARRKVSKIYKNGKVKQDWDKFFDPENIKLDQPNWPVISIAKMFNNYGTKVFIFSGRSKATKDATRTWLAMYGIPYNILKMRPTSKKWMYMPDDKLKQDWLEELFPGDEKDNIVAVFDDRNKVVDMWRKNGLTCMQVAPGDF